MTTGEMLTWTNRLKEVLEIKNTSIRDLRLANMMTDLEKAYRIPVIKDREFEKMNPFVIRLYRTVSEARSI